MTPSGNRRRLTAADKWMMCGMGAYAFADAFLLALHWYDWTAALFFEVPLLFVGRALWDTIKIGKDGIELSVGAEAADSAEVIDTYVAGIQARDAHALASEESPAPVTGTAAIVQAPQVVHAIGYVTPPPSSDPLLAAAQIRISIERELRRMALLSGLIRSDQNLTVGILRNLLSRHELFPDEVSSAIDRIVKIANAMLHGADVSSAEQGEVIDSGMRAVLSLTELTHTASWISQSIFVRAQKLGLKAERLFTFMDTVGDVYVEKQRFDIVRTTGGNLDKDAVTVIATSPPPAIIAILLETGLAVAWVADTDFQGTPSAVAAAPWLVSSL